MKSNIRLMLWAGIALLGIVFSTTASATPINAAGVFRGALRNLPFTAPAAAPQSNACSGTPQIQYFTANPLVIAPGQISTLQWGLVGNADSAYLITPAGKNGVGTPGSQQVNPTQTTTYTLIGYCGSVSNQVQVTITVQSTGGCSGVPFISSFIASPTTVQAGQSTTLSWGPVSNADNVVVSSPQGSGGVATPGQVSVPVGQTTTFTLTAWCQSVSTSAQATVTAINPNPPPPTPPPSGGNAITGVNLNAGLTTSTQIVLTANYIWTCTDAPAVAQSIPFNAAGQQIGSPFQTNIRTTSTYANLQVLATPSQVRLVSVCLVGSSGTELACQNWTQ